MTNPLQDADFYRDRYPFYARARTRCPVLKLPADAAPEAWLVTGYAEAREALTHPNLSKNASQFFAAHPNGRSVHPALSKHMLNTDPPEHTRLRKLVTKAFTTGAVNRLRPSIQQLTNDLLDRWQPSAPIDAMATFAIPLPVAVICELLGVPERDRATVSEWASAHFATGQHDRIDAASRSLADYLTRLITTKRRTPDDSLLTDLIAARDGNDQLSEDELVALAYLLVLAGHETTTNLIGNSLLALLQHPDQLRRLREQPDLVPAAIDELLRYDAPASIATFRYTTAPTRLGDVDIPADAIVHVSAGAANRDPARYPDPDRLDLDRDATGHLAFGHGIHRCLGAPLAQAEAEIALRAVLTRFPDLRLAVLPGQLAWRQARLVRGLIELPVLV